MNETLVNIRKICTKYNLSVSARVCLALIVEYYLCNGNKDDMRQVLEENVEYFPIDIIQATNEVIEYLKESNLSLVDYKYSDKEYDSWQKFDIDGQEWYILFTLINGCRSDFVDGGYTIKSLSKSLDKDKRSTVGYIRSTTDP